MAWTKRDFVLQAFDEIGLGSYAFDLQPEQLNSALFKLDAMMAHWNGKGIRLGYPLPDSPNNSTLDQDSGVPDSANMAIVANLAVRIAPSLGKTVSPDTKAAAKSGYDLLLSLAANPIELGIQLLPSGAGNKPWNTGSEFIYVVDPNLQVGDDGDLTLE